MIFQAVMFNFERFFLLNLFLKMLRNRKVFLAFQQHELRNNFEKYKKLAELQSKLIRNDFVNSQLNTEIHRLREENQKLRQKIHQKEAANTIITLKSNTNSVINKVNSHLSTTKQSTIQALKHKFRQNQQTSYSDLSKRVSGYFHKPKQLSFGKSNEEQFTLSKNVYIDKQPLKERHMSLDNKLNQTPPDSKPSQRSEVKHVRNHSASEHQEKSAVKEYQTSKFPSNMNEFQGKKAQSRFLQCQVPRQPSQSDLNRWKSEENFGIRSQLIGHMKSQDMRKRKTFLSIVSVSSVQNKKNKQN